MNPLSIIVLGIAITSALCGIYSKGYQVGYNEAKFNSLMMHTEELGIIFIESEKLEEEINNLDISYTLQQIEMRKEISRLKMEAVRYEQNKRNRCMVLDHNWVLMHNEAASLSRTTNTTSTGLDDGKPKTIEKDNQISVIVDNYSTCALYIEQLKALQDYVKLILTQ